MPNSRTGPRAEWRGQGDNLSLISASFGDADALLRTVRRLALRQQRGRPQAFISLRQAAARFGVKTSAMAAVYRQLAKEGIFAPVRGARTMLRPKRALRGLETKGFIGMPVSTARFLMLREYREAFLALGEALFARGFMTRCIFFEGWEIEAPTLIKRLAVAEVDAVLWLFADGAGRDVALRVRDRGLGFIGVTFASIPGVFCRYEVRRRRAIAAIFRHWRADATMRKAAILRVRDETAGDAERAKRICAIAEGEDIDCEFRLVDDHQIAGFIKSQRDKDAGVVLPAASAAKLAWHAPQTIVDLLDSCRVALVDGPVDVAVPQRASAAAVDLATV